MHPILHKQHRSSKPQWLKGLIDKNETKMKLIENGKNKKIMQTKPVLFPILPLRLTAKKPKPSNYPKLILTIGDEFKSKRLDEGLTQEQVAKQLNVNRNFVYELELGKRKLTIYVLHKAYEFLRHFPRTLNVDDNTLQGKLFAYRIKNGLTYSKLAERIGLDKSTLIRFEKGLIIKPETKYEIEKYIFRKRI